MIQRGEIINLDITNEREEISGEGSDVNIRPQRYIVIKIDNFKYTFRRSQSYLFPEFETSHLLFLHEERNWQLKFSWESFVANYEDYDTYDEDM